jgi:aminopeptidase N
MKFILKIFIFIILFLNIVNKGYSQITTPIDKQWMTELINSESKAFFNKYSPSSTYTSNYDIKFHRIKLFIDPSIFNIEGEITTYFVPSSDLDNIKFDFTDIITIDEVKYNGTTINFSQADNILTCSFNTILESKKLDSIKVHYSGTPQSNIDAITQKFHNNTPIISTLSEPYGAKDWWPCKQDLIDKIDSIEVIITSPKQYKGISNGLLVSEEITNENRTCTWKHNYPIPAYLIAIAVTNYTDYIIEYTSTNGDVLPILNHIYPEDLDLEKPKLEKTTLSLNLYESLFEPYPYSKEKYGHAQFPWHGGMEHTTVSFMGSFSEDLIAHELAHQWFGDKITCGSWCDIWLNEGFATYLTGLTYEHYKGNFIGWLTSRIDHITEAPDGSVYVTDTTSVASIFNSRLSYSKGAMVLHMLRFKIGDDNFFRAIKNYLNDDKLEFSYAKTEDFIKHCEIVYGKSLTQFFDQWIYKEGYPSYTIEWKQNQDNSLSLKISQTQSHPSVSFFEMPIELEIKGTDENAETIKLDVNNDGFYTTMTMPFEVTSIVFDPHKWLITKNNSVVMNPNLANNEINSYEWKSYFNENYLIIKTNKKAQNTAISLFDTSGRKILSETFRNENSFKISTKNISSGIYYLVINSDNYINKKTLIK